MIPSSSAALRSCFLGASTALHVAAFVVSGHPDGARTGEAPTVDIAADEPVADVEEPAGPVATADENVPRVASLTVTRATHAPAARGPSPQETPTHPSATPRAEIAAAPARFALVVSSQAPVASGGTVSERGDRSKGGDAAADQAPMAEADVASPAQLTGVLSPGYPPAARAQEVEAEVVLSIVVSPTGRVTDLRVVRAAGYGFDDAALRAVRGARFVPARQQGRPVAVRMRWTVTFRLR